MTFPTSKISTEEQKYLQRKRRKLDNRCDLSTAPFEYFSSLYKRFLLHVIVTKYISFLHSIFVILKILNCRLWRSPKKYLQWFAAASYCSVDKERYKNHFLRLPAEFELARNFCPTFHHNPPENWLDHPTARRTHQKRPQLLVSKHFHLVRWFTWKPVWLNTNSKQSLVTFLACRTLRGVHGLLNLFAVLCGKFSTSLSLLNV